MTFGEVYEGIYHGSNPAAAEAVFLAFLARVDVSDLSLDVWKRFARVRGDLRSTGQLIAEFDILIAATALHHDLTLVTRNLRHYERIPGLKLYRDPAPAG